MRILNKKTFKKLARIFMWLVILGIAGIAALLGTMWLDHTRETILPTPTGPYAVGRTTLVWTDASQLDTMAPNANTPRQLFAWIWYPAAPSSHPAEDYLPAPLRIAIERQRGTLITKILTRDLSRVHAHSIHDADVSPQQPTYPVVLMTMSADFTTLAEDLASHGYVVVGIDAPYQSSIVVFPDGKTITRGAQNSLDLVSGEQAQQLADKTVQAWSSDMSFSLDRLDLLNRSDPSGKFAGRLDMQHIGVFGFSIGGAEALQFCHDDPRCKACIDMDGIPWGSVVRDGFTQPSLFLMSDHSGDTDGPDDKQIDANFRSIFAKLSKDRTSEITIKGANHYGFDDDGALLKSPLILRTLRTLGIGGLDGRRQIAVTAYCLQSFFDTHLKGAPDVLSNGPSDRYPELIFQPK